MLRVCKMDFSLLDMNKAYADDPEYAKKSNTADYFIKWGDYRVKTVNNEDVVFVPIIINKKKHQAFSLLTEEGRFKGGSHQIYITMMLREGNYGDKGFDAAVGTYMYGHNMKDEDIMRMGLDFESADYNGYFIVSALDGTMLTGRYIEEGKTKALFIQNPLSPKERKAQAQAQARESAGDTIKNKKHEHLHIFLNYLPNRVLKRTKSGGDDIEWIVTHCSNCGELWENCDCYTVTACSHCGYNLNTHGQCPYACSWCGVCLYDNPGHTHNSGGDGGTGGTGGGGGPSPGPDPEPEPKTFTEMTAQERANEIRSKMNSVVASIPGKGMQCNNGVGKLFKALFGDGNDVPSYMKENSDGNHILANQMIHNWQTDTSNWQEISRSDYASWQAWFNAIQEKADSGYFVVSALLNEGTHPDGTAKHGHVTVIRPGGTTHSNSWGFGVPTTMDTGSGRRDSSSAISNSYKKSTIMNGSVKFYFYKK